MNSSCDAQILIVNRKGKVFEVSEHLGYMFISRVQLMLMRLKD